MGEANKFLMFINDEADKVKSKKSSAKHKCFPITQFNPGSLTKYEHVPYFDSIPSRITDFFGRQQEMCEVIAFLQENRLVNILGPPGIGKTSIARQLCNHLKDRKKFYDGIMYLNLRGCESAQMFLTRLSLLIETIIQANSKNAPNSLPTSKNTSENDDIQEIEKNIDKMRNFINKNLKDKEVLIVMDGCEYPLEDDCENFVKELESLLDECDNLKLLLTSRKYINKLEHNHEVPYHLYALSPQASLKLLLGKAPREVKQKEIQELLGYQIPIDHPIRQQFPVMSEEETNLSNHPFTLMLGGHPQAVSLAAPMLERQSLLELFKQLLESNIMDALAQDGTQSYASLRVSLEISIKNIKKHHPETLEVFKFIGLLSGGVNQNELTELWGQSDWRDDTERLIKASLLIYRPVDNYLSMLPFMNARAFELLEEDGNGRKQEYHIKICKFYQQFCIKFMEKINLGSYKLQDLVEKEANIWGCIYRGINRKRETNEYDREEDDESFMHLNTMQDVNMQFLQGNPKNLLRSVTDLNKPEMMVTCKTPIVTKMPMIDEENNNLYEDYAEKEDLLEDIYNLEDNLLAPDPSFLVKKSPSVATPMKFRKSFQVADKLRGSMSNLSSNLSNSKRSSQDGMGSLITKPLLPRARRGSSLAKASMQIVRHINPYEAEEMLVLYYISIVIRLCKLSDAHKALQEYLTKKDLSNKAKAHLFKLQGVLALLSEKKDYNEVKIHFKNALEHFYKIGSSKGRAICRLALVRVQCEVELTSGKNSSLNNLISIAEKAKDQFTKINYKLGEERAQLYIDFLNKRIKGEECSNFKKFVKFKTFKGGHIAQAKSLDNFLESNILKDEDIKLFVDVVDSDEKRDTSNFRISSKKNIFNLSKSRERKNLSICSMDSTLTGKMKDRAKKLKKIRLFGTKKVFVNKKETKDAIKNRIRITKALNMEKLPPLQNF